MSRMNSSRADALVCPICLEPYGASNPSEFICLNHHRMCTNCLDSMLTAQRILESCPECRSSLMIPPSRQDQARARRGIRADLSSVDLMQDVIRPYPGRARPPIPPRLPIPPLPLPAVYIAPRPAEIIIHPPAAAQVGAYFANSHIWVYLARVLVVILVWGSAIANIYYYVYVQPKLCGVLFYLLLCQFYAIGSNTDRIYEVSLLSDRTKQLLRQVFLFTLCERMPTQMNLSSFLFHVKDVGLIISIVLISIYSTHQWTSAAIANLTINCLALVCNILAQRFLVDDMLRDMTRWLEEHDQTRKTFVYTTYVICWAIFGFSLAVLWKIEPIAFGMELFVWFLIGLSTLCWSSGLDCLRRLRNVFSLPFHVSTMLTIPACSFCIWVPFLIRYVQLPILFCTTYFYSQLDDTSKISPNVPYFIASFLLSIFSPIEIIVGNSI